MFWLVMSCSTNAMVSCFVLCKVIISVSEITNNNSSSNLINKLNISWLGVKIKSMVSYQPAKYSLRLDWSISFLKVWSRYGQFCFSPCGASEYLLIARHLLVNLEKLGFHEKLVFLTPYGNWGGFDKTEVSGKWCATLWALGLQFFVSPNSQIFNFQDFR